VLKFDFVLAKEWLPVIHRLVKVSFRVLHLFYLLTVGVEVVYFHLITLTRHSQ
jgi:hypothetical protein